ncbi:virulence factor [Euzebya tangerina]|uniref:virulence factor n=1 Tax=Euzebya tangerina TaxID=591198 RepID=UPI000E316D2C|nr:virulence factor [Euzebya tangerina]
MSRRSRGPELTVIEWRGIPAQVTARHGRAIEKLELPLRFQRAIDVLSMRLGLDGTDDYLDAWERRTRPCGPDLVAEVRAEAERLEGAFDATTLRTMSGATPDEKGSPTA